MEEYLTVKELSEKIKFSKQSLYNLIHRGTFVLGKHYLKPTPKKVLFKWTEIRSWMGDDLYPGHEEELRPDHSIADSNHLDNPTPPNPLGLINI